MSRILIVEDDADISKLLERIIRKEGHEATCAFSGTEAELRFSLEEYQLVLCDLMIPGINGETLIARIRERSQIPIIALTARLDLESKVHVLELGADDYVTKPFEPRELAARIKTQLRRENVIASGMREKENIQIPDTRATSRNVSTHNNGAIKEERIYTLKELSMNVEERLVKVMGVQIELTHREFDLLLTMLKHPQKVYSKESLYEAVWMNGYYGEDNTVSVHISNIRKKISIVTPDEYIATVWGIGYRLCLQ